MRYTVLLFAFVFMRCGSEAEVEVRTPPAQQPAAVVEAPVPAPPARHRGTVVMAGRHPVEVVPHRSGQVYAYTLGDAPPHDRVGMTVTVPVRGRETGRPVRMLWDPRDRRYEGRVRSLEIVEGPLDVALVVDDVEYIGHTDVIVVLPAIAVQVIEVRGKHKHKGKHRGVRVIHIH